MTPSSRSVSAREGGEEGGHSRGLCRAGAAGGWVWLPPARGSTSSYLQSFTSCSTSKAQSSACAERREGPSSTQRVHVSRCLLSRVGGCTL